MKQPLLVCLLFLLALLTAASSGSNVFAAKSPQAIQVPPALVYSQIDGKFTDLKDLKLTPLGEKLVSQDKSWMPTNEWADALQSPLTLYANDHSLTTGNAYMRLKYYEKGWIDDNRWLDILVDHVADPAPVNTYPRYFFSDDLLVYFNPSLDYGSGTQWGSRGDYLFDLVWWNQGQNMVTRSWYWSGPFTQYWEGDAPSQVAIGKSSIGISPDFPEVGPHVIYELRFNLDYYYLTVRFGDSFGFAIETDKVILQNGSITGPSRMWPVELAQNGMTRNKQGCCSVVPTYSGTIQLVTQPVIQVTTVTTTLTTTQQQSTTIVNTMTTTTAEQIVNQSTQIILAGVTGLVGLAIGLLINRLRRKK